VDVYYDWVDACDAVAKEHGQDRNTRAPLATPRAPQREVTTAGGYDEKDDFVVPDDGDAEGEFVDEVE